MSSFFRDMVKQIGDPDTHIAADGSNSSEFRVQSILVHTSSMPHLVAVSLGEFPTTRSLHSQVSQQQVRHSL